jgi:hypothetical protein
MFHVLAERWSWQEDTARDWLRRLEGTSAFEAARQRAGVAALDPVEEDDEDEEEDDEEEADEDEADEDDEEMN